MQSWQQTCEEGDCDDIQRKFWETKPVEELYDTKNDPWEVNNLAGDPAYSDILHELRRANREWMVEIKDAGVIPEFEMTELTGGESVYDYLRRRNIDVEEWIDIADKAITAKNEDIPKFSMLLTSQDPVKRYWAATAFRILGDEAGDIVTDLKKAAIQESSPFVKTILSELLYILGEKDIARDGLAKLLEHDDTIVREFSLNAIESLKDESQQIQTAVIDMAKRTDGLKWVNQDHRIVMNLLNQWGIEAEEVGLEIDMGWLGNIF